MRRNNEHSSMWMKECRGEILENEEWQSFSETLKRAVESEINEQRLPTFNSLSGNESSYVVERAVNRLTGTIQLNDWTNYLSKVLDKHIHLEMDRLRVNEAEESEQTKDQLISDIFINGLLRMMNDNHQNSGARKNLRRKFHIFLIRLYMPTSLRYRLWDIILHYDNIHNNSSNNNNNSNNYNNRMTTNYNRRNNNNNMDGNLKLRTSFEQKNNLRNYLSMSDFMRRMNDILLIHHKSSDSSKSHRGLLLMPIVLAFQQQQQEQLEKLKDSEMNENSSMMFGNFLRTIGNRFLLVNDEMYGRELNQIKNRITSYLTNHNDMDIVDILRNIDEYDISINQMDDQNLMNVQWLSELVKNGFIGYLNENVLLLFWDHMIIGCDVNDYHIIFISIFIASLFQLMKQSIVTHNINNSLDFIQLFESKMPNIRLRQMTAHLELYYSNDIESALNLQAFNVHRQTEWHDWHNDTIPERIEQNREQLRPKEDNSKILNEIAQLRNELKQLRSNEEREKSAASVMPRNSVINTYLIPVNSKRENERHYSPKRKVTPPTHPRKFQHNDPLVDLISCFAFAFDQLANGKGNERILLEEETKRNVLVHKQDLKIAEKQVFNRVLTEHEWQQINSNGSPKLTELLEVMKRMIQNRYQS
ncbi:hypothetical protein SNEBB_002728 [Seison nebaliae]|nr:hypothetical protein SNEBB_002728 [Seison nebaliae]